MANQFWIPNMPNWLYRQLSGFGIGYYGNSFPQGWGCGVVSYAFIFLGPLDTLLLVTSDE